MKVLKYLKHCILIYKMYFFCDFLSSKILELYLISYITMVEIFINKNSHFFDALYIADFQ